MKRHPTSVFASIPSCILQDTAIPLTRIELEGFGGHDFPRQGPTGRRADSLYLPSPGHKSLSILVKGQSGRGRRVLPEQADIGGVWTGVLVEQGEDPEGRRGGIQTFPVAGRRLKESQVRRAFVLLNGGGAE